MGGGCDSLVLVLHTYLKCSDPSIYNDGFDNNAHNIHTHTHTHLYDESHESLFSLPRHSLFILSSYSLRSLFALSSLLLLSSSYKRVELCRDPSARQAAESRLELPCKDVHNDTAVAHEVLPPRLRRHTLQLPFILRIIHVLHMLVR